MKLLKSAVTFAPKMLGAISLVAGLSFSTGVYAENETHNLGTLSSVEDLGNTYSFNKTKGSFNDTLTFNLDSLSNLTAGVGLFSFNLTKNNISDLAMALFDQSGTSIAVSQGGEEFTINNLHAGSYYATVSGNAIGKSGGVYGVTFAVSPVPEAETYAMLLAGLGVISLIGRRRRQNSASAVIA
jgi:hypothetical protein